MGETTQCARCKEPIEKEPVVKGGKSYCSEACAFDATERSTRTICGKLPTGSGELKK